MLNFGPPMTMDEFIMSNRGSLLRTNRILPISPISPIDVMHLFPKKDNYMKAPFVDLRLKPLPLPPPLPPKYDFKPLPKLKYELPLSYEVKPKPFEPPKYNFKPFSVPPMYKFEPPVYESELLTLLKKYKIDPLELLNSY